MANRLPMYSYPRAGARGDPDAARAVEALAVELTALGIQPATIGPTFVQGFARFYRRLPANLPGIDKGQIPALYALLGSGTPPLKMSREDAAYQEQPHPSRQRCDNCSSAYTNVVAGDMICSQISGEIQGQAWCRLWNCSRF